MNHGASAPVAASHAPLPGKAWRRGPIDLSHKHRGPDDTTDKPGLPRRRKENLPTFLKAFDKKGKDGLSHIFEERAKNEDEKIPFSEFSRSTGLGHRPGWGALHCVQNL
uniref:Uncharacterized protein n=1 Tax=Rhinolophus ferrumequinum TaxID=59479 RepID=A0A671EWU1_RHIFE